MDVKVHRVFPSSYLEIRIFTDNSISLKLYRRQCRNHFTIQAGLQLIGPRYYATLRQYAAVYLTMNKKQPKLFFLYIKHWAGLKPYTS